MLHKSPSHTRESVQDNLNRLHDTFMLTWDKISQMWPYLDIPPGTLSAVASGKRKMPGRFKNRFSSCPMDAMKQSDLQNALKYRKEL